MSNKLLISTFIVCIAAGIVGGIIIGLLYGEVTGKDVVNTDAVAEPAETGSLAGSFTFDDLLDGIEWVESRGDPNAVCPDRCCVGAYQLSEIYMDDVNRIASILHEGHEDFELWRRFHRGWSRATTQFYIQWYGYGFTLEQSARIHNGGPDGWKKASTKPYWEKVKARMESTK